MINDSKVRQKLQKLNSLSYILDTRIWSIKPSHASVPLISESAGGVKIKVPFVQLLQRKVGENFVTFFVENIHFLSGNQHFLQTTAIFL